LVQPRSRLTKQAETEALWQLKDRSFSQVTRELRVSYGTLHHLLEGEIDEVAPDFIQGEDEIYLGIDEHNAFYNLTQSSEHYPGINNDIPCLEK